MAYGLRYETNVLYANLKCKLVVVDRNIQINV